MTDRERLLEQIREAEERAGSHGRSCAAWVDRLSLDNRAVVGATTEAVQAAHHALTALALREAIEYRDRTEPKVLYVGPLSNQDLAQLVCDASET